MEKKGRSNIKFIISSLFVVVLMAFVVIAVGVELKKPTSTTINDTRGINFTFNVTWDAQGDVVGNCSLWTNFSAGVWAKAIEFNGTDEGAHNASSNITQNRTSYVNYTFSGDTGLIVWDIACRNGTGEAASFTFAGTNNSLAIDTVAPRIIQTENFFSGSNTTYSSGTLVFNLTDVNGTGVNLTTNGDNETLNFTIHDVNSGEDDAIAGNFTIANSTYFSCDVTGSGVRSTQCTLSNVPLSNGTKNITIIVSDAAETVNLTNFLFTVDTIAPSFVSINFTNNSAYNLSSHAGWNETLQLGDFNNNTGNSRAPGSASTDTIYAIANWTDNLTQPAVGLLQFYNTSSGWQTLNTSPAINTASGLTNFSYQILPGHSQFSGANISFRIIANDTVGNVNDSMSVQNFTILINDTTAPTIFINGSVEENGTNLTTTTPIISWYIEEASLLTSINVSVDRAKAPGSTDGCGKFRFFDESAGQYNVEKNKNGSFSVLSATEGDSTCPLRNGTHVITVTAIDSWGNTLIEEHNFTVQSGRTPEINITVLENGLSAVAQSNVTPYTGLNFTINDGLLGIKNMSWTSTCNSTVQVINGADPVNDSYIWPFNYTNCRIGGDNNPTGEANLTVTVTGCDFATPAACTTTAFQFAVDDLAPTLTVHSPTNGLSSSTLTELNVSALDGMNRVDSVGFYLDGDDPLTNVSFNKTPDVLLGLFQGENVSNIAVSANFTAGTHTIKFRVNDSQGNYRNSSVFTFTQVAPVDFSKVNSSITLSNQNATNVSFYYTNGTLLDVTATTDQTMELLISQNGTYGTNEVNNFTIDFNGSAANWNNTDEIYVAINNSKRIVGLQKNHTVTVVSLLSVNASFSDFIGDTDYFGKVTFTGINATNDSLAGLEIWWLEDDLNVKTNATQCSPSLTLSHSLTSGLPCWNNTNNKSLEVFVPHFSDVALVNDTDSPTVSVNYPEGVQIVSSFIPNITVSNDAVKCNYSYVGASSTTNASVVMTITTLGNSKVCSASEISVANGTIEDNNVTFNVQDASGNLNTSVFNFNVSDTTPHNVSTVVISGISDKAATVTVTANESVNLSVYNSTGVGATTVIAGARYTNVSSFSKTPELSFSGLAASTKYNFTVRSCDKANNCLVNLTLGFTTSAAAEAAAASSSSGGSSGGGGGSVATSNVADSKAQVWNTVPAGSSFSLDVDKETIAITSVAVNDVKSELSKVELDVAALSDNPVSTEAAAKVYQYLRITKRNLVDSDAGSFKVGFRVTKAWLTDNGLTSSDVALYRYNNGWNQLTTRVVSTDNNYVNFEADTPGFSSFAVGVKTGVVDEEETADEAEESAEDAPDAPDAPDVVDKPKPVEAPGKAPTAWVIAAIVAILGIVLIVMYQKKKK